MEEKQTKDKKRRPLAEITSSVKIGKYDSIFRPSQKDNLKAESESLKELALPPISSKHLWNDIAYYLKFVLKSSPSHVEKLLGISISRIIA